ncbi:hypothetical protein F183_A03190 [Bryobacterales bacterium F-183]|nr:hypothetical protein F183_A03190 [Bryobacterales bacterium F-183]
MLKISVAAAIERVAVNRTVAVKDGDRRKVRRRTRMYGELAFGVPGWDDAKCVG